MAILGNNTNEVSALEISDIISGSIFTAAESGEVTKISAYISMVAAPFTNLGVRCAIYNGTALEAVTNEVVMLANATVAWYDFTFASNPSIVNGVAYTLSAWADLGPSPDVAQIYSDTTANLRRWMGHTYLGNTFPDPASWTTDDGNCAIYATYTPAPATGGGPIGMPRGHRNFGGWWRWWEWRM